MEANERRVIPARSSSLLNTPVNPLTYLIDDMAKFHTNRIYTVEAHLLHIHN